MNDAWRSFAEGWFEWLKPALLVIVSLAVSSLVLLFSGHSPLVALGSLWSGAFGSMANMGSTLVVWIPLSVMAVGIAIAFKGGLFNIGAQGQYWIGAIAATLVGTHLKGLPAPLHITIALVVAIVAGGLYGLIPGIFKAYRGAHEVISTMMLSYAAVDFGHYLLENGPMMLPGSNPESYPLVPSAILPNIIPYTQLSLAVFVGLLAVVAGGLLLARTRLGFEIKVVGSNPEAARAAGMRVPLLVMLSLAISGAFGGLAGGLQITGVSHQLFDSFASQYGFTAIAVSLLARNNPWGCIPAALLFAALHSGSGLMQMNAGIPAQLSGVVQGLIIFFVATDRMFDWLRRRRRSRHMTAAAATGGSGT